MKKIAIKLISIYQKYISPDTGKDIKHCIYNPTCSEYAKQAINKHGIIIGTIKGIYRIIRCNPFSKGGNDEV